MPQQPVPTARARARAGMIEDIKAAARDRLAAEGPNLSLRAVARDIGVVSSAVYRYFASRDELLTALIIDAYDELGGAVERTDAGVARRDPAARWLAVGRAVREWALAHPHDYALLYGSPVPGYAAPQDTVGPASRPVVVLAAILRDAAARADGASSERLPKPVRDDVVAITEIAGFEDIPPALLARGLVAWAQLFGAVSFELFGRLTGAITDYPAYFDYQLKAMARFVGV